MTLRLRTLGGLSLASDETSLGSAATQRRPLALLALLAAAEPAGMSRDKIVAYLWPERDGISSRNTLKQMVYLLRRDLASRDVIVGNAELRINRLVLQTDLWEFDEALAQGSLDDAFELYRGPFLDGFYLSGAVEFERWVEQERSSIAQRAVAAAHTVGAAAMKNEDYGRAVTIYRRVAALDPLSTRSATNLMTALAATGDHSGALKYGQTFEAQLRAELDVDAGPDFQAFVNRLRASGSGLASTSQLGVGPHQSSVPRTDVFSSESLADHARPPFTGDVKDVASLVEGTAQQSHPRERVHRRWGLLTPVFLLALAVSGSSPFWYGTAQAWVAFRRGVVALSTWDTERARADFNSAIESDSSYVDAYLSLAEIAWWSPARPTARDDQSWAATMALRHMRHPTAWSRTRALALQASAEGRWLDACRHFNALIQTDSSSFGAWYGRAECLARDSIVVSDSSSPSGWRFRTSYQQAIGAYVRAFQLRPDFHQAFGGHAIAPLSQVLFLQPNKVRRGFSGPPRVEQFVAFPSWDGDSIAFVPYPLVDVQRRRDKSTPTTTIQAVAHSRETLRRLTALWAASSPGSADAFEAVASVLEMLGELDVSRDGLSAERAIAKARQLARTPEQQLRLAVTDVRFNLKRSRFSQAQQLIDSLLAAWQDAGPSAASWLAPLAALSGRARLAAKMSRAAAARTPLPAHSASWSDPPLAVVSAWVAFLSFASSGAPQDSAEATYRELESLLRLVEPAARHAVRSALMQEPSRFAAAWLPESSLVFVDTAVDPIAQMQRFIRRGNSSAVRSRMASLESARAHFRLADRWPDAVLLESRLLLGIHDTASAIAQLDPYLSALPVLHSASLDRVQTAASLGWLILLRAQIAAARRDTAVYVHWMDAMQSLWVNADPELRSMLQSTQPR